MATARLHLAFDCPCEVEQTHLELVCWGPGPNLPCCGFEGMLSLGAAMDALNIVSTPTNPTTRPRQHSEAKW